MGLFPTVPKDLAKLSDTELSDLLGEFESTAGLIDADDEELLAGLKADEVIAEYESGAAAIKLLRTEVQAREEAAEAYVEAKAAIKADLAGEAPQAEAETPDEETPEDEEPEDETPEEPEAEVEDEVKDPVRDKLEAVVASDAVEPEEPAVEEPKRLLRRTGVPTPAPDRIVVDEKPVLAFVASGLVPGAIPGSRLETRGELAHACKQVMDGLGRPTKTRDGREDAYRVAQLDYRDSFGSDRVLTADAASNSEKIAAIGSPFLGRESLDALVASGGFCAPFTPVYTMPQLATRERPVRDGLPNFRAERGGINVPTPTTMGDAAAAITVITAAEDALGGTFATKACLDLDCPAYTETAVTIISHCREYGNLVAMSWPEKIAHENDLTMAEHARIAESYLLGRLKTLSVNVTGGAVTLGALIYLVESVMKAKFGMRSRLRLPSEVRFDAYLPRVLLDMLELDTINTQFDRYRTRGEIEAYLGEKGIDVTWYIDTPLQVGDATAAPGDSQIADAAQTAAAIDPFPTTIQWAIHPKGTFLHLDMAELNLGIVRDSTLNSTNDFQNFGEVFENVARIGPAQAAYWVTSTLCANGEFPPLGTGRTCP